MPTAADASQMLTVLNVMDSVEIDETSEATGNWRVFLSCCCSAHGGTTAYVARLLKGLPWSEGRVG